MKFKPFHSVSLIPLLLFNLIAQESGLRVAVIEGDGTINNIRQRINPEPVVEVQDANGQAVANATVTFIAPTDGPGGSFANGTNTLTVTTDRLGRVAARGFHPNNQTGKFEIRVRASYQGQTANAVITETNIASSSAGGGGMGFGTKAWIILAICAGAVAGAVIAATHGHSSSTTPPIVITPGTPTVGAPK